jgi:glutathione synthase/RimK-type ligase-like ATP-grasp enzyme
VGSQVFTAAIHSQDHESTRLDWRRDSSEQVSFEAYDLPSNIEDKLLRLVGKLGLVFGAVDMIVTPDGSYTFLEINPSGQFGFVEVRTGLPISSAIADLLMAGTNV